MAIICPECGGESFDPEFCDLCNAELSSPSSDLVPEDCPLLAKGERLSSRQRQRLARPESAVVVMAEGGQVWRVHWLGRSEFPRWFPLIEERTRRGLAILPPCRQIDDAQGMWLAFPCHGRPVQPWWADRAKEPLEEVRRLYEFVQVLARTLTELNEHNLVWLNFDPEEIEEIFEADGSFRLCPTNLDLQIFPVGYFPQRLIVNLSCAAPEVCRGLAEQVGPATDVYHLALFCYYWLARLLPDGFAGAGLPAFAYRLPAVRIFVRDLPPGLAGVLGRGLEEDPRRRPPTPAAFMAELGQALQAIEKRWESGQRADLTWEIGAHTRTGRSKMALIGRNEDSVLVKEFVDPPRALLAVADGISICDVGNGAVASSTTLAVLERNFTAASQHDDFAGLIVRSTQEASRSLIDWAVKEGQEQALREEKNLMGTTLCAGWLQGNWLNLANLGDSRAYLVTATAIEQLTVDGDMSTSLLAEGTPPEQVLQLGGMGKALRDCVGGCQITPAGELAPWTDAVPDLSRFPLLPGDVIVLCSDGLIEEGVFLNAETVFKLIQQHRDLPAAQLAELLAQEADALQRLPSSTEPEGFGDNISCVVLKVI